MPKSNKRNNHKIANIDVVDKVNNNNNNNNNNNSENKEDYYRDNDDDNNKNNNSSSDDDRSYNKIRKIDNNRINRLSTNPRQCIENIKRKRKNNNNNTKTSSCGNHGRSLRYVSLTDSLAYNILVDKQSNGSDGLGFIPVSSMIDTINMMAMSNVENEVKDKDLEPLMPLRVSLPKDYREDPNYDIVISSTNTTKKNVNGQPDNNTERLTKILSSAYSHGPNENNNNENNAHTTDYYSGYSINNKNNDEMLKIQNGIKDLIIETINDATIRLSHISNSDKNGEINQDEILSKCSITAPEIASYLVEDGDAIKQVIEKGLYDHSESFINSEIAQEIINNGSLLIGDEPYHNTGNNSNNTNINEDEKVYKNLVSKIMMCIPKGVCVENSLIMKDYIIDDIRDLVGTIELEDADVVEDNNNNNNKKKNKNNNIVEQTSSYSNISMLEYDDESSMCCMDEAVMNSFRNSYNDNSNNNNNDADKCDGDEYMFPTFIVRIPQTQTSAINSYVSNMVESIRIKAARRSKKGYSMNDIITIQEFDNHNFRPIMRFQHKWLKFLLMYRADVHTYVLLTFIYIDDHELKTGHLIRTSIINK